MQTIAQLPLSARWFSRFRGAAKPHDGYFRRGLPMGRIVRRTIDAGERIDCVSGRLWVTLEHRPEDIVLGPGESIEVQRRTVAVVESLENAIVEIRG